MHTASQQFRMSKHSGHTGRILKTLTLQLQKSAVLITEGQNVRLKYYGIVWSLRHKEGKFQYDSTNMGTHKGS
jgi:hypothetical protein